MCVQVVGMIGHHRTLGKLCLECGVWCEGVVIPNVAKDIIEYGLMLAVNLNLVISNAKTS